MHNNHAILKDMSSKDSVKYCFSDGTSAWYIGYERHREDGPAVEYPSGAYEWWLNNSLHRENGPAIEYPSGYREWWINGKRHRENGPAIELSGGRKEWWLNGKKIDCSSQEEFERIKNLVAFL